ncbi:MAG: hypothetical protein ACM3SQ_03125 [Betaproteobacteria bacterium]
MRLKVETNTREHFAVYGFQEIPFSAESRWFSGACSIHTYASMSCLAPSCAPSTAQGRPRSVRPGNGAQEPERNADAHRPRVPEVHEHEGHEITRAEFEENLAAKTEDPGFLADVSPLLAPGYDWQPQPRRGCITVDRDAAWRAVEGWPAPGSYLNDEVERHFIAHLLGGAFLPWTGAGASRPCHKANYNGDRNHWMRA